MFDLFEIFIQHRKCFYTIYKMYPSPVLLKYYPNPDPAIFGCLILSSNAKTFRCKNLKLSPNCQLVHWSMIMIYIKQDGCQLVLKLIKQVIYFNFHISTEINNYPRLRRKCEDIAIGLVCSSRLSQVCMFVLSRAQLKKFTGTIYEIGCTPGSRILNRNPDLNFMTQFPFYEFITLKLFTVQTSYWFKTFCVSLNYDMMNNLRSSLNNGCQRGHI